jgi:DNA-binding LacI/PurR family transcriptional regulator/DNA-binding transcriptional regulator YhcF (GntR family)
MSSFPLRNHRLALEETMKVPLYEQLYRFVLGEIDSGHLVPGARVPSEKELADQFHVSRITSKRALEKLAHDGLIERARGRGSFVAVNAAPANLQAADRRPVVGMPAGMTGGVPAGEDGASATPLLVGLLVPDTSDIFGAHLVRTIESELRRRHIRTILCRTEGRRELEEAAIDDCLALGVTGLIICPVHGEYYNERLLRLVLDHFPIVLVDRYLRGIPACSVCTDNRRAAEELTNDLIAQGHRHFAFVTVPPAGTSSIEDRLLGIMSAIAEHGLHFNAEEDVIHVFCTLPGAMTPATQHIERDTETIRAYAARHPEVTAYVACEYPLGVLTQRVLVDLGRDESAVCGLACFDAPHSPLDVSPITYIEQDEVSMGCEAVALLLAQVAQREVPLHVPTSYRLVRGQPA